MRVAGCRGAVNGASGCMQASEAEDAPALTAGRHRGASSSGGAWRQEASVAGARTRMAYWIRRLATTGTRCSGKESNAVTVSGRRSTSSALEQIGRAHV